MDEGAGLVEIATWDTFHGGGVETLDGGWVVKECGAEDEDGALGAGADGRVIYLSDAAGEAGGGAAEGVAVNVDALGIAVHVPGFGHVKV